MKAPVLVLGATGVIGRGIVQAAVEAATPVIAVARDPLELECLRTGHAGADLTVLPGSVAGDADGAQLAQALRELGRPLAGVVVAVSGSAGRGRLLDRPVEMLQRQLDEDLLPHLVAARHLLPLLSAANRGGSYVLIGGPGSDLPWAGYGHRSVAAAAQRMLACVLHDEARALSVRVQLLSVDRPVCPEPRRAHMCPQWPTAIAIGRRALALIEGVHDEPARAVVRYTMRGNRPGGVDVGVDFWPPASTPRHPPEQNPGAVGESPQAAQEPDSDSPLLTARCLQDARTLLRALTSPNRNEASPHGSP